MKKKTLSAVLFVVVFIAVYLILCFGIPGLRIKLEAEPIEIFFASISHMVFFKAIVSLIAAALAAAVPFLLWKKR
ncbi:MAG: hypothetical protein IKM38_04110 [Christensenellaceae bacterium]|nr:hypothetical protein [Christensenellaceae bacterium]MBR3842440.1 hypothetical protein [Christensenellaceae bacterium]